MAWWLEPWSCALAAICIFLVLAHLVQMILGRSLIRRIRGYRRDVYEEDGYYSNEDQGGERY